MKLESFSPSDLKGKKYKAVFRLDSGRTKTIHFGAVGYQSYPDHRDEKRKDSYIARHSARENFNDPTTAGALSRWILWNKTTILGSLADFKRRFDV